MLLRARSGPLFSLHHPHPAWRLALPIAKLARPTTVHMLPALVLYPLVLTAPLTPIQWNARFCLAVGLPASAVIYLLTRLI